MPACTEIPSSDALPLSGSAALAVGAGTAMNLRSRSYPGGACGHRRVPSATIGVRSTAIIKPSGRKPANKVPA
jgi:hypothetical protein